jgi:hypothetical protein
MEPLLAFLRGDGFESGTKGFRGGYSPIVLGLDKKDRDRVRARAVWEHRHRMRDIQDVEPW